MSTGLIILAEKEVVPSPEVMIEGRVPTRMAEVVVEEEIFSLSRESMVSPEPSVIGRSRNASSEAPDCSAWHGVSSSPQVALRKTG
ncbi:hypothetical protein [Desulfosediminicola ganghwensis]|uniref:hypothetical protein n=1 Tax=Desulfosediminicola ganghwensis TaxID=2569540 RepID=UPI0010AC047E|nr:hypothetical protein [Desulfosediminicola ganghwensis]